MLKFNPNNILSLRGVEKTTALLVKLGMKYSRASRFLNSKSKAVNIEDIERLCIALNCTPNDLFEWTPDETRVLPETHSLNSLRGANVANLQELVKDIPSDKLETVAKMLNEMKNNGKRKADS